MLDAIYVAYWSYLDPLCQSQSLPIIRGLCDAGWRFGLVTFEQSPWRLKPAQRDEVRSRLAAEGIRWYPLRYHQRPTILSTLLDIAVGASLCAFVGRRCGARAFHGRGTVSAAMAYVAARLVGVRIVNDADGPLSQEYVDAGVWSLQSPGRLLTHWFEQRCLRGADEVAVLTERRRREVEALVRREVTVLPCAVDLDLFRPEPDHGRRLRADLGMEGTVLVYAGKTGGWYLTEPMLDFVASFRDTVGEVTLLVLTTEDPARFLLPARARGIRCVVRNVSRPEMPSYLSSADAGLSFRLDAPSQTACSPIKNGEYLACGLPVVTTAGVGDYSELIARSRVGVVVPAVDMLSLQRAARSLKDILEEPGVHERCRETADRAVSLRRVVMPRYHALYGRLLGQPAGGLSP
jgi:glycosyltransferase involved in cell wall biosynthesis